MKKIALFSGGRGNKNLLNSLKTENDLEISVIINGFDDGLSTGRLRRFIPGMLGPSDFRKNISYLGRNERLLKFLDFRLAIDFDFEKFDLAMSSLDNENNCDFLKIINYKELNQDISIIKRYIKTFYDFDKSSKKRFNYSDCAIGNIVFSGMFLECRDFQKTVDLYSKTCDVPQNIKVINIDEGMSYRLVAILSDGTLLKDEASIVEGEYRNKGNISSFYLIPFEYDLNSLEHLSFAQKVAVLNTVSVKPNISELAKNELNKADLIIYGSGTQFSSLLPSYFIVGDYISKNLKNIIKINIANLNFDNDIYNFAIEDILDQVLYLQKDTNNTRNTITYAFIHNNLNQCEIKLKNKDSISYKGIFFTKDDFLTEKGHNGHNLVKRIKEII